MTDVIRGEPSFPNSSLEDFVIARGDGSAVFLLANVVDDLNDRQLRSRSALCWTGPNVSKVCQ